MAYTYVYVVQKDVSGAWVDCSEEMVSAPSDYSNWEGTVPATNTYRLIQRRYTVTETVQ